MNTIMFWNSHMLLKTLKAAFGITIISFIILVISDGGYFDIYQQSDQTDANVHRVDTIEPKSTHDEIGFIYNVHSKQSEVLPSTIEHKDSTTLANQKATGPKTKLNVLFIISDDLRPQLNSYKGLSNPNPHTNVQMHTPHLDKFGARSLQLNRAYVQYSSCNPSRTSFLTSRRPDTTKVVGMQSYWRVKGGNFTTIPQYFKQNGYRTHGLGKIFHPGPGGGFNDPLSWTEKGFHYSGRMFYQESNVSWWAVPEEIAREKPLHDEEITDHAIDFMQKHAAEAATGEQPFFLAVGFRKPHTPYVFPERYLKFYPLENIELANNSFVPRNFPDIARCRLEGSHYDDILPHVRGSRKAYNESFPDFVAKLYRRAYFACVTFVDDMVGRLLATLSKLGLENNTIVSFIGDHGYHLGENGMWGKHTNLEQSSHAPLLIHIPGRTDGGIQSDSLVEFIDLFPTLSEAAGLGDLPECPQDSGDVLLCTEGKSFLRLVDHPKQRFKDQVMSQIYRSHFMGYTLRTDRYRFVQWSEVEKEKRTNTTCWNRILLREHDDPEAILELYDLHRDPQEDVNVAKELKYRDTVQSFNSELRRLVKMSYKSECPIHKLKKHKPRGTK